MKPLTNASGQLRRLPIGAELTPDGVHFRVWAPNAESLDVVIESPTESTHKLTSEGKGYFSGCVQSARAGMLYRFRLDQGATLYPDLASRFQPDGPHGASAIVDPLAFPWTDDAWRGVSLKGQVIYECTSARLLVRVPGRLRRDNCPFFSIWE
jgi:maltooligosyltrehalose trehalohydrolase